MSIVYSWTVLCCFIWIAGVSASPGDKRAKNDVTDVGELKRMYTDLLKENKRMKRQIGRINVVYHGLQKMCEGINDAMKEDMKEKKKKADEDIELRSISSTGGNHTCNVTINFRITGRFDVQWTVAYGGVQLVRTRGELTSKDSIHSSRLPISWLSEVEYLSLAIESHAHFKYVVLTLDHNKLMQRTYVESLTNLTLDTKLNRTYKLMDGQDFAIRIPILIDGKLVNKSDDRVPYNLASGNFVYMNTSIDPFMTTLHDRHSYGGNDGLVVAVTGSRSDAEIVDTSPYVHLIIRIDNELVQSGGLLTVFLQAVPATDIIKYLQVGRLAHVVPAGAVGPFPRHSLSIFNDKTQYVSTSRGSVSCYAYGNPITKLTMLKERGNDRPPKTIKTEGIKGNYRIAKTMVVLNKTASAVRGLYICRASNGSNQIETHVRVEVFSEILFRKVGLKKNTSDEMVVTCKAIGSPRPTLRFRTWAPYGEDLSQRYTVTEFSTGKYKSRIDMSIPADDTSLNEVYCVAMQDEQPFTKERRIVLREVEPDEYETPYNTTYYSMYSYE